MFGAVDGVLLVALAVGSIAAPFLVSAIGERGALLVAGALLPVLARADLDAARGDRRRGERAGARARAPARSPIFAPLPPATLEALAVRLEPRAVDAGRGRVRAGRRR